MDITPADERLRASARAVVPDHREANRVRFQGQEQAFLGQDEGDPEEKEKKRYSTHHHTPLL